MGWIKNRINAEYKKHNTLDWAKIAESKINKTIEGIIDEWLFDMPIPENIRTQLHLKDIKELKIKLGIKTKE